MALRGSLKEMSLTSLITVNCNERCRSRLRVQSRGREGTLFFEDGNLVHATSGSQEGESVVYELLSWDAGEFELETGAVAARHSIHTPWSNLLLNAMARLDEQAAAASTSQPVGTAPSSQSSGAAPSSPSAGALPPSAPAPTQPTPKDAMAWPMAGTVATDPPAPGIWTSGATLSMTQSGAQSAFAYVHPSSSQAGAPVRPMASRGEPRVLDDAPDGGLAYDQVASDVDRAFSRLLTAEPAPLLVSGYDDDEPPPDYGEMPPAAEWAAPAPAGSSMAQGLLEHVCGLEGVDGALVVARDGTLLASRWDERADENHGASAPPSLSTEDASAQAAAVVVFVGSAARDMSAALHLGALACGVVQMGAGRARILILEQPEYFVGLLLGAHAAPSLVAARAAPLLAAAAAGVSV